MMKSRRPSTTNCIMLFVIAALIAIATFQGESLSVAPGSHEGQWVRTSWWGLRSDRRPARLYGEAGVIQGVDGKWYPFTTDHDQDTAEPEPVR